MLTNTFGVVAIATLAAAAPLAKRNNDGKGSGSGSGINDGIILNYALTLEHLEQAFYQQGLRKYDAAAFQAAGYSVDTRNRVTEIAKHENDHVAFLEAGLAAANVTAVKPCQYSFPHTDPKSFLAVSQILEGVGVSAYLGAAASIVDPDYLTAAASILSIEARHSAWVRSVGNGGDPFPQAFDTPLGFNQVYSLAAPFITSCPEGNPALPVKAFPALMLKETGGLKAGQTITLSYEGYAQGQYAVFYSELSQKTVSIGQDGKVKIPTNLFGQLYVVIAKGDGPVSDETTVAGPAVVEVDFSPSKDLTGAYQN